MTALAAGSSGPESTRIIKAQHSDVCPKTRSVRPIAVNDVTGVAVVNDEDSGEVRSHLRQGSRVDRAGDRLGELVREWGLVSEFRSSREVRGGIDADDERPGKGQA